MVVVNLVQQWKLGEVIFIFENRKLPKVTEFIIFCEFGNYLYKIIAREVKKGVFHDKSKTTKK